MTYDAEAIAIFGRLNSNWTTTSIAWPNTPFLPTPGTAWIRPTLLPADAWQTEIGAAGSRNFRHAGLLIVQIFVPEGTGDGTARDYADTIAAIFRGVSAGGVTYAGEAGDAPRMQVVGNDGQGWFQVNVLVPYRRDDLF